MTDDAGHDTTDGGSAFPNTVYFGMTLLDYFAGKALAGMNWRDSEKTYDEDAEMCYKMAAAMLRRRHND